MKICVFCGSRLGRDPRLVDEVYELGRFFAAQGFELVYGGGKVGLMGRLADGVLAGGGRVTGIIPRFLSTEEVARHDLTTLEMVDTMEQRKRRMFEISDLFLTLPGGYGSLDELFEAVTLSQLRIHDKENWVVSAGGYYDDLARQLDRMVADGFMTEETRALCRFWPDFESARRALRNKAR